MTEPAIEPPSRTAAALRWGAWAVIMFNALVRVVVALDPFPQWAMDPTITTTPRTALGPAATLALDAAVLLAAGLVWIAEAVRGGGRRTALVPVLLTGAGAAGAAVHGFAGGVVHLDNLRIGASWAGAVAGAVAIARLAQDARIRRLTLATAIGVIGMLAARGALEVFVEHPDMVRRFERDRAAILGAHGWSEGSTMARGFERRLRQAEATGWFGLANVYASFAASSMVTLVGIGAVAWRAARRPRQGVPGGVAGVVSLGAVAAGCAVVMAGSKAGYAVAGLGLVLLAIAWLGGVPEGGPRWLSVRGPIVGGPLAVAMVAAVLVAVLLRGAIGESLREPSVLFRWFYLQGAARVIADHPGLGVGPDGFKDAYMLAKPPLSPEAVESPHSIVFDYLARLGLPGLAWTGVFGWLLWRAGAALTTPAGVPEPEPAADHPRAGRADLGWIIALTAAPTLLSAWLESPITTIESAAARGLGLLAWGAIAWAALWTARTTTGWTIAAAAGAIVLAAHAQIEMTPVQPASAPWFFLVLGCAAPVALGAANPSRPSARLAEPALGGAFALAALALAWFGVVPVARWESRLTAGAREVETLATIRARLGSLSGTAPAGRDSIESIARDLGRALGRPPPTNDHEIDDALRVLTTTSLDRAAAALSGAASLVRHAPTLEALSRLHLARAAASADDSELVRRHGSEAERIAEQSAALGRSTASSLGWLGTVRATRAELERDPAHLARAVDAWRDAAARDPHGLTFAVQVFNGLVRLDRPAEAREWARRILALNEQARLDPLMQLTDTQRAAAERALNPP